MLTAGECGKARVWGTYDILQALLAERGDGLDDED